MRLSHPLWQRRSQAERFRPYRRPGRARLPEPRPEAEADHPLLAMLRALPPHVAERCAGGTALHMASRGLRALLRPGFLPGGRAWELDSRRFVHSAASWAAFLRMRYGLGEPGGPSLPAVHADVARAALEAGDEGLVHLLRDRAGDSEPMAFRWTEISGFVAETAGRLGMSGAMRRLFPRPQEAAARCFASGAAEAGCVDACLWASRWLRTRELDEEVTRRCSPADIERYAEGLGRPLHPRALLAHVPAQHGNAAAAAWLVRSAGSSWDRVMSFLLGRAVLEGDTSLLGVRAAIAAGCPADGRDYLFSDVLPGQVRGDVVAAFHALTGARPEPDFFNRLLQAGNFAPLDALAAAGVLPDPDAIAWDWATRSAPAYEWLASRGVPLQVRDPSSYADLGVVRWLLGSGAFAGLPDAVENAVRDNNYEVFDLLLREGRGFSAERVVHHLRARVLDARFALWAIDNLVDRAEPEPEPKRPRDDPDDDPLALWFSCDDDLVSDAGHLLGLGEAHDRLLPEDEVMAAALPHIRAALRRPGDGGPRRHPALHRYLRGLDSLPTRELRAKCRALGVKPRGVAGGGGRAYADCIRGAFRLPRTEGVAPPAP